MPLIWQKVAILFAESGVLSSFQQILAPERCHNKKVDQVDKLVEIVFLTAAGGLIQLTRTTRSGGFRLTKRGNEA
jgi:hypothetical protein